MSDKSTSRIISIAIACTAFLSLHLRDAFAQATVGGGAVIEKPTARSASGGRCNIADATFGAVWGPAQLPLLAFTIGPKSAMADMMHADKRRFEGAGVYKNVVIAVYLGKTALEDAHAGLGTVTVNADGRSGTFILNDGSTAGHWACESISR